MDLNTHADKSIPWWVNIRTVLTRWDAPITAANIKAMFAIRHDDCPVKISVDGVLYDVAGIDLNSKLPGDPIEVLIVAAVPEAQ